MSVNKKLNSLSSKNPEPQTSLHLLNFNKKVNCLESKNPKHPAVDLHVNKKKQILELKRPNEIK